MLGNVVKQGNEKKSLHFAYSVMKGERKVIKQIIKCVVWVEKSPQVVKDVAR